MDVLEYNRAAWDASVANRNQWTLPVDSKTIQRARNGEWSIVLTPLKPVPFDWFPDLQGLPTLCLASGGGQQGPVLATAGAKVTVFDNSPRQLGQDHMVAEREGLDIELVRGDMRDLSRFDDEQFWLVVHPVSNCFSPNILPVWECRAECARASHQLPPLRGSVSVSVRSRVLGFAPQAIACRRFATENAQHPHSTSLE